MNRKIAISGFSIITALTLLTTSAFAAFTTQAQANTNTFSTGTDHLQISSDNITFTDSILSPFLGSKITPGTVKQYTFYLHNDKTNSNDDLNVSASFANGTGDTSLEDVLSTQFSCTDSNGTTTPSAFSVTSMLAGSVSLGKLNSNDTAVCTLTVTLPSTADNTVSNKTTSFDVHFDGAQVLPL